MGLHFYQIQIAREIHVFVSLKPENCLDIASREKYTVDVIFILYIIHNIINQILFRLASIELKVCMVNGYKLFGF